MTNSETLIWHFIPPRLPHFGGLWEAGMSSMKYHLNELVGITAFTFKQLDSSRGMSEFLSNDSNDLI
jgi:hypothetical protein